MSNENDPGSRRAFPTTTPFTEDGMSLRDYHAAHARPEEFVATILHAYSPSEAFEMLGGRNTCSEEVWHELSFSAKFAMAVAYLKVRIADVTILRVAYEEKKKNDKQPTTSA